MRQWTVTGLLDEEHRTLLVAGVFDGVQYAKDSGSHSAGMSRFCTHVEASSLEEAEQRACAEAEGTGTGSDDDVVLTFTRGQVAAWAGRRLDPDELACLEEALPDSSFPDAVSAIAGSFDRDECGECGGSLDDGEGYEGLCGNCADAQDRAAGETAGEGPGQ